MSVVTNEGPSSSNVSDPELPIAVFGADAENMPFYQNVAARNLSRETALLDGLNYAPKPGKVVGVYYKDRIARVKVLWVCEVMSRAQVHLQAGVQLLIPEECPWFEAIGQEEYNIPGPLVAERRKYPRFVTEVELELSQEDGNSPILGESRDLSLRGCYVRTSHPAKIGTELTISLFLETEKLNTTGIVRACHPGKGMGIELIGFDSTQEDKLREYLNLVTTDDARP